MNPYGFEDYQMKLQQFLEQIPASGQVKSMAEGSKTMTLPYTKEQVTAHKGLVENPVFEKYTGYTTRKLLLRWTDPNDRLTTCNEFCSKCGNAMGYKAEDSFDGVGRFDIADYLTRFGKGHCWVPASSGATPEYGDIFRMYAPTKDHNKTDFNHMGVSLSLIDGKWNTVESGQAGPSKGYDAIERKTQPWMPAALQGWVSMRALLGTGKRVQYWLGGWWEVEEGAYEVWYYYFGSDMKVYYSPRPPISLTAPPLITDQSVKLGTFEMKGQFQVKIRWNSKDVDEELTAAIQESKKRNFTMVGRTTSGVPLTAKRMMIQGLL